MKKRTAFLLPLTAFGVLAGCAYPNQDKVFTAQPAEQTTVPRGAQASESAGEPHERVTSGTSPTLGSNINGPGAGTAGGTGGATTAGGDLPATGGRDGLTDFTPPLATQGTQMPTPGQQPPQSRRTGETMSNGTTRPSQPMGNHPGGGTQ